MLALWNGLISDNKDEAPSQTDLTLVKLIPPGPRAFAETIYTLIYKKEFTKFNVFLITKRQSVLCLFVVCLMATQFKFSVPLKSATLAIRGFMTRAVNINDRFYDNGEQNRAEKRKTCYSL